MNLFSHARRAAYVLLLAGVSLMVFSSAYEASDGIGPLPAVTVDSSVDDDQGWG